MTEAPYTLYWTEHRYWAPSALWYVLICCFLDTLDHLRIPVTRPRPLSPARVSNASRNTPCIFAALVTGSCQPLEDKDAVRENQLTAFCSAVLVSKCASRSTSQRGCGRGQRR
ncbi:hypothetical protein FA95DRAFT_607125 [Auriscalpium vulgare]|uniref:Uncharacterized protein n=1 Tax=Auriscalpium vulgare TaxID=40419 RepID=A0ACB8RDL3_9AGAM|nr:hypothetical protein FA95DRAFT_607125 [Auriscalpium vulgare]